MKTRNKFILSFIALLISIIVVSVIVIVLPTNQLKRVILPVGLVCYILFLFAGYYSLMYYRRWQGYYSKDNKFLINVKTGTEFINKVADRLLKAGYRVMEETENYCLYEFISKNRRTTYYFLIYKNKYNHREKSYSKLAKELDNNLAYYPLKLSTKSGHLIVIEELTVQDKTRLYTESRKMTCDFILTDYNNKCCYIESSSMLNALEQRREIKKILKDLVIFTSNDESHMVGGQNG